MLKVLDKLQVGDIFCISVEGDIQSLKKGMKLNDERGNIFELETIAMSHYRNIDDYKRFAEIVLRGDIENIGKTLFLHTNLI